MDAFWKFMFAAEGWLVLGVVLFVLEFFIPGIFFMWLGFAAIALGIVTFIAPSLSISAQLVIFAVLGVIFVYAGRSYLTKRPIKSEDATLNRRGEQYIGKECEVVEAFKNGRGRVRVEDTIWGAIGPEKLTKGRTVKVIGVEGTRLKVEANKSSK